MSMPSATIGLSEGRQIAESFSSKNPQKKIKKIILLGLEHVDKGQDHRVRRDV